MHMGPAESPSRDPELQQVADTAAAYVQATTDTLRNNASPDGRLQAQPAQLQQLHRPHQQGRTPQQQQVNEQLEQQQAVTAAGAAPSGAPQLAIPVLITSAARARRRPPPAMVLGSSPAASGPAAAGPPASVGPAGRAMRAGAGSRMAQLLLAEDDDEDSEPEVSMLCMLCHMHASPCACIFHMQHIHLLACPWFRACLHTMVLGLLF